MTEKKLKLTAAQQGAVEIARKNGGVLNLYDGGFWRGRHTSMGDPVVSDSTVQGLVRKGVLEFTKRMASGLPIRAELAAGHRTAPAEVPVHCRGAVD